MYSDQLEDGLKSEMRSYDSNENSLNGFDLNNNNIENETSSLHNEEQKPVGKRKLSSVKKEKKKAKPAASRQKTNDYSNEAMIG